MTKLVEKGAKLIEYLREHFSHLIPQLCRVDMKAVKE